MPKKENRLVECACGCSEMFLEKDKYGRKRTYLKGHHTRNPKSIETVVYENYSISPKGCWEWGKALTTAGYGSFGFHGKSYYAHRASYEVANGITLKQDECVCHECDNPKCINPDHLFIGSHLENMHDAIGKGRFEGAKTIISDKDVTLIKSIRKFKMLSQPAIAKLFKINQSTISRIVNAKRRTSFATL